MEILCWQTLHHCNALVPDKTGAARIFQKEMIGNFINRTQSSFIIFLCVVMNQAGAGWLSLTDMENKQFKSLEDDQFMIRQCSYRALPVQWKCWSENVQFLQPVADHQYQLFSYQYTSKEGILGKGKEKALLQMKKIPLLKPWFHPCSLFPTASSSLTLITDIWCSKYVQLLP